MSPFWWGVLVGWMIGSIGILIVLAILSVASDD